MCPVAVLDVDLAGPVPAIAGVRDDGTRVARAFVLVRCGAVPLRAIVVDVPEQGLTPAQVQAYAGAGGVVPTEPTGTAPGPPPTVVICTRGRPAGLARALESLQAQTFAPARVLVVDSGAVGAATQRLARDADADYLPVPEPGLARARNAAVRHCPGEAIAWLDDDEVADRHWVEQASLALAERADADVICGAVVPAELETPAQVWFEALGGMVGGRGFTETSFGPATRASFHPLYPSPPVGAGANMVTRAGVVERLGGFDPALGAGSPAQGGEDTLLFARVLRAGGTVLYRPRMLTRHFHRADPDGLRRQLRGYGTGLTAMYLALLRQEPAAVWSLLGLIPRALRQLGAGSRVEPAVAGLPDEVPAHLRRALRSGMAGGPRAYVRGRRALARAGAVGRPS
jgi:GT2 family glycosyltransferase